MRTSTPFILVSAGAVLALAGGLAAQTVPDRDEADFENGVQPLFLVAQSGLPSASLTLTTDPIHVHDGLAALEFSLDRDDPVDVIVHKALMTDLVELRFWAKAERSTTWVVSHLDRDGALFNSFTSLAAGQWTDVRLTPADFQIDPNSPVQKAAMEPHRNGMFWSAFDLEAVIGPGGPNRVWLDTLALERPDLQHLIGPITVMPGQPLVVTQSTLIDGDLNVAPGARFESTANRLVHHGNLLVLGSGAEAVVRHGTLRLGSQYPHQREWSAAKQARLRLEDLVYADGTVVRVTIGFGAGLEVEDCAFQSGGLTATALKGGRFFLADSDFPGEFLVSENCELIAQNLDRLMLWLVGDEGLNARLDVPPQQTTQWSLGSSWDRTVDLTNVAQLDTGLILNEGCNLLLRNGTLRAVGLQFLDFDGDLANLNNGDFFQAQTFAWPGRNVRFENVTVQTWNHYARSKAKLTLRNCSFGEAIASEQALIRAFDSTCDGSGGYLGVRDQARMLLQRSDALCEIIAGGDSRMAVTQGQVLGPVTADDRALIGLLNCTILGPLIERDQGQIKVR